MGQALPSDAGGRLIDPALDAALARIAELTPLVVASDYDGTLSPIVDDPAAAQPDRVALDAFVRLAEHPVTAAVIVSGRSVDVLEHLLGSHPDITLIGSHGASLTSDFDSRRVDELVRAMVGLSMRFEGAEVEPKPTGAAFHYRHALDQAGAADSARRTAISAGANVIEGKQVVEAVVGVGDKGTAIRAFREGCGAEGILFIGDDVTDEAVFKILGSTDIGIKVGEGATAASFRVPDVLAVADVFETLSRYLEDAP